MVRGWPEFKQTDTHTPPRFVLLFKDANFVLGWTGPGPQMSRHCIIWSITAGVGPIGNSSAVIPLLAMQWQRQQYPNSL